MFRTGTHFCRSRPRPLSILIKIKIISPTRDRLPNSNHPPNSVTLPPSTAHPDLTTVPAFTVVAAEFEFLPWAAQSPRGPSFHPVPVPSNEPFFLRVLPHFRTHHHPKSETSPSSKIQCRRSRSARAKLTRPVPPRCSRFQLVPIQNSRPLHPPKSGAPPCNSRDLKAAATGHAALQNSMPNLPEFETCGTLSQHLFVCLALAFDRLPLRTRTNYPASVRTAAATP